MMTKQQNKWNADAEVAMMNNAVSIESTEHLEYVTAYVLRTLDPVTCIDLYESLVDSSPCTDTSRPVDPAERLQRASEMRAKKIIANALMFNSDNDPITHLTVTHTMFGNLITYVRDSKMKSLTDPDGILAYVCNVDAPECSELGYVFFENCGSFVRRIS